MHLQRRLVRLAAAVFPCLLVLARAHADSTDLPPAVTTPSVLSSPHFPDGLDRPGSGLLQSGAEAKSRANALYAQALISMDGSENNTQTALEQLRQVVALDPHEDAAQIKIAHILLQTGQVESAYDQLRSAAAASPHSVEIEALLGYTQRLRGQDNEALRLSTDALSKDPNQAVSMQVLLEIAQEQQDLSGAVVHIEDLLKNGGSNVPASAWLTLGRLYVDLARDSAHNLSGDVVLKTLLPIYQQAAAKAPPDVERLTLLAETYQDLGRKSEALKTLRRAGELDPANIDILLRCAHLEMDLGDNVGALKDYQQAYDLNPNLNGLREMLGRLYLDHGDFTAAARLLEDALTNQPGDPDLEADLGVAFEGAHQHAVGESWFERAFAATACPPEAYLKLAVVQLAHRQVAEAGLTLAAAHSRFPTSAKVRFYEAIQDRYTKNYPAALACLKAMRTLAPSTESDVFNADYYLESALTMSLAHQENDIEPLLREGLEKFPDDPDLMNELAYAWADRGDHLPEALALSRHATEIAPDNGAFEDTCGWVYFKMGEVNDALPYLQRAAVMTNNDPVVLQHVGDAYLQLGRRREAIATWRHALEKDSGNHDLTTRIAAALAQANHANTRSAPIK
jgi:tetratricopeptide (TPR) repeat protein